MKVDRINRTDDILFCLEEINKHLCYGFGRSNKFDPRWIFDMFSDEIIDLIKSFAIMPFGFLVSDKSIRSHFKSIKLSDEDLRLIRPLARKAGSLCKDFYEIHDTYRNAMLFVAGIIFIIFTVIEKIIEGIKL